MLNDPWKVWTVVYVLAALSAKGLGLFIQAGIGKKQSMIEAPIATVESSVAQSGLDTLRVIINTVVGFNVPVLAIFMLVTLFRGDLGVLDNLNLVAYCGGVGLGDTFAAIALYRYFRKRFVPSGMAYVEWLHS